jgi:D-alanine-D-alanine ligase
MSHHKVTAAEQAGGAKPRVAVLFGGRSSEHAVSCVTAAGVLGAINKDKYEVIPIGIAKTGQWVLAAADTAQWSLAASSLPEVAPSQKTVTLAQIGGEHQLIVASPNEVPQELGAVDVVFPLLHGPFGEDGTIQGLLELSDTRYVGAGVLASAVGMDKHFMKVVFEAAGLQVGPYIAVTDRQWRKDAESVRKQVDRLGFPVFVKPARAGSSMGISKVDSLDELDAAIEEARRHDLNSSSKRELSAVRLNARCLKAEAPMLPAPPCPARSPWPAAPTSSTTSTRSTWRTVLQRSAAPQTCPRKPSPGCANFPRPLLTPWVQRD